jgi:hypothetical protein
MNEKWLLYLTQCTSTVLKTFPFSPANRLWALEPRFQRRREEKSEFAFISFALFFSTPAGTKAWKKCRRQPLRICGPSVQFAKHHCWMNDTV